MTTDYTTRKTWVEHLIWDNRREQPHPPTPGNPCIPQEEEAVVVPEEV
jgi:hypothetical protein